MKHKLMIPIIALVMLVSGCATAPNGDIGMTQQGKQALGTVVGAGVGGYFGSKVGGDGKNTAGTVAGTILGGAIGGVLASQPVDGNNSYYYGGNSNSSYQGQSNTVQ